MVHGDGGEPGSARPDGLRRLLNEAWSREEAGDLEAALAQYRCALARAQSDGNAGMATEIGMIIGDLQQRRSPGSSPPARRLPGPGALARASVPAALAPGSVRRSEAVALDNVSRLSLTAWLAETGPAHSLAFAPGGERIAVGKGDGTVLLCPVRGDPDRTILTGHTEPVLAVAFHPSGSLLASGGADGTVRLWHDLQAGRSAVLRGHAHRVTAVAFSPDGSLLASGSRDGTVRLWHPARGGPVRTGQEARGGGILCLAFAPDGTSLATGTFEGVRLWRLPDLAPLRELRGFTPHIRSVAFDPGGGSLAAGAGDGAIRLWRVVDGMALAEMRGHTAPVSSVCFSPDGSLLLSASADSTLRFWNAANQRPVHLLKGHTNPVESAGFSPDGGTVASVGYEGVRLWGIRL